MSLKTLITAAALLVGSSTAALAEPYYYSSPAPRGGVTVDVRDHRAPIDVDGAWMRNHRRRVVRPARAQVNWYASASYNAQPSYWNEPVYQPPVYQPPVYQPAYQQPSLTLMAPSMLGGRFDLDTTNQLAGVSTIRLDATGCEGRTYVDKVTVYDDTGHAQQIAVNRYFDANSPVFDIGLTFGARTTRVIVDGQSQLGGTLAVEAL